jgi:hypothetical protein
MSLSISGSSPDYAYSKDPVTEANSATQEHTAAKAAIVPKSQYLGGYISSASAALSLLTQSASEQIQHNETVTSDRNGTTIQSDGFDIFKEASGLGTNVYAQAFASNIAFRNAGGQTEVSGNFVSTAASSTSDPENTADASTADGSTSGVQVTADITNSNAAGTSISIKLSNDPKAYDNVYIGNGGGPNGAISDFGKQGIHDSIQQFFKASGLSDEAAKKEADAVSNFTWAATDPVSRNEAPTAAPAASTGPAS